MHLDITSNQINWVIILLNVLRVPRMDFVPEEMNNPQVQLGIIQLRETCSSAPILNDVLMVTNALKNTLEHSVLPVLRIIIKLGIPAFNVPGPTLL